jgi:hypothetical protein
MSGIRELIVVSAAVLAFSASADAAELRPIAARGIDQAVTAAPAVEVRHGPRVRGPSLGGKTTADIPIWRTVTLGAYKTIDALRDALILSASMSETGRTRCSAARRSTSAR